ncbi:hypothetical protein SELMODRAFT_416840 [Selaginella moellendorffii]|uniref:Uncharacterized protein n=1 Tax=Selaginella moellendorffii TaxID=88036 RepID=D8S0K3_SELML|nr:hypothetical protein SELMODRAFT_416840 [Selaginella moellendorffii]
MSSEDYIDEFQKLLRLTLTGKKKEKVFNKYYPLLLCHHDMINLQWSMIHYEHIFCGNKTKERPQYCMLDCTIGHQRYGRERRLRLCFPFVLGFLASLLQYHNVLLSTLLGIALVMKKRRKEAPVSLQDDILETVLSYVDLATLLVVGNPVIQECTTAPLGGQRKIQFSGTDARRQEWLQSRSALHRCRLLRPLVLHLRLGNALVFSPQAPVLPSLRQGLDDYFYDPTILGFYDFGRARWSTGEVMRSLRITAGLEDKVDPDGEILRCVLPLPGLCTARLREYNGQRVAGCMREATARQGSPELMAMACGRLTTRVAVSAKTPKAMLDQVYAGQRG